MREVVTGADGMIQADFAGDLLIRQPAATRPITSLLSNVS